jgi:hypothetical protein
VFCRDCKRRRGSRGDRRGPSATSITPPPWRRDPARHCQHRRRLPRHRRIPNAQFLTQLAEWLTAETAAARVAADDQHHHPRVAVRRRRPHPAAGSDRARRPPGQRLNAPANLTTTLHAADRPGRLNRAHIGRTPAEQPLATAVPARADAMHPLFPESPGQPGQLPPITTDGDQAGADQPDLRPVQATPSGTDERPNRRVRVHPKPHGLSR